MERTSKATARGWLTISYLLRSRKAYFSKTKKRRLSTFERVGQGRSRTSSRNICWSQSTSRTSSLTLAISTSWRSSTPSWMYHLSKKPTKSPLLPSTDLTQLLNLLKSKRGKGRKTRLHLRQGILPSKPLLTNPISKKPQKNKVSKKIQTNLWSISKNILNLRTTQAPWVRQRNQSLGAYKR